MSIRFRKAGGWEKWDVDLGCNLKNIFPYLVLKSDGASHWPSDMPSQTKGTVPSE